MAEEPLRESTVEGVLEAVASSEPVPGGGAVAALAGAAAASLLAMVTSLALRRAKDTATPIVLNALLERAHALRERFLELADADVSAYRSVADALALTRATDEERARRAESLQRALTHAAEVPLETARCAVDALRLGGELAPLCPRVAHSDLVTATHLAHAACMAALANVDANALSLDPSPRRAALAGACADLAAAAHAGVDQILAPLEPALGRWRAGPTST